MQMDRIFIASLLVSLSILCCGIQSWIGQAKLPDISSFYPIISSSLVLEAYQPWDLVLVDRDHSWIIWFHEARILEELKVPVILTHYTLTTSTPYISAYESSQYFKIYFQGHPDYFCLEESKFRPDIITSCHGFFCASKVVKNSVCSRKCVCK